MQDFGDRLFSILLDESRDVSIKEQVAIVLCYVDFKWHVIEYFLDIVHVIDTTASSLKAVIEALFSKHNLNMSRIVGKVMMEQTTSKNFDHEYECIHSLCLLFCLLISIDIFNCGKESYSNCMYRKRYIL